MATLRRRLRQRPGSGASIAVMTAPVPRFPNLNLRESEEFAPLFSACDRLEGFVLEQFPHALKLEPLDSRFLSWATAMRALKSLDALLLVADAGYGEQAMMLSRTIFEDAVVAWWCSIQDQKQLLNLMNKHEKSVALGIQRAHPGRVDFEALAAIPTLNEGQLAGLVAREDVDPTLATRHWTGRNIAQMVAEIEGVLTVGDAAVLRKVFDASYLLSNLLMHHSTVSTGAPLQVDVGVDGANYNTFSRRPSPTFVHDALAVAFHSLSLMARLVTPPTSHHPLDILLTREQWLFAVGRPAINSVGRNDPCPCGSGVKQKFCHGRIE